ncbi:MAG: hypothetical protein CR968_00240 [Flavobacteriia bacterium]|nr:MAG: hypothetical protein CR968_00240 [Flavobacteriia bacterium]
MSEKLSSHIDNMVLRLFLVVFFIAAFVLVYKVVKYTPCRGINFEIKTKELVQGKLIKFVDNTANATSWEWDFGDSTEVIKDRSALHVFNKPGEYNVSLMVNGICKDVKRVVIKKKPFVIDSTKLPIFKLPATVRVGDQLKVIDKTKNASTWEWRFGETAGVNATTKRATYVYQTPGLKTVSLVVNGDLNHARNKQIEVLPLKKERDEINQINAVTRTVSSSRIKENPTINPLGHKNTNSGIAENDDPDIVPFISASEFKNKLNLVARKKLSAEVFKRYLCGDLNKSIIVNGETTTFLEFCELITTKKLKIKEVKLYRSKDNCITNITIKRSKYIL